MTGRLFAPASRRYWQAAFLALFLLAPALDLFRLDLEAGHFWLLGMRWTLGLHELAGADALTLSRRVFTHALLPAAGFVLLGLWVSWRFGRIYCGWLCPHFLAVELVNGLMRRASGRPSLWQRQPLPEHQSDGTEIHPHPRWWLPTLIAIPALALLWSVTLLSYLLPPSRVWSHLLQGTLTQGEGLFLGVATLLLSLEFALARHLFCRYGCAVGLFQSLAWLGNPRALVVGFDRAHAAQCADCDASCEHACPMRIRPRQGKRLKFACTQCQSCITACARAQSRRGRKPLLRMLAGECARAEAAQQPGHHPRPAPHCFEDHR